MKEFIISLVLMLIITCVFWGTYHVSSVDERTYNEGLPEFSTTPTGVDVELEKLLAEADAGSSQGGAGEAEVALVDPTIEIGKELYNQSGANSCLYCHGTSGTGGSVASAAKLNAPASWKITKILGGSSSIDSDKFKEATVAIIAKGAIVHNSTFKDTASWFDIKKAGSAYDSQMVGLTGAPSASWVRKNKANGINPQVAAESLYMYIRTF